MSVSLRQETIRNRRRQIASKDGIFEENGRTYELDGMVIREVAPRGGKRVRALYGEERLRALRAQRRAQGGGGDTSPMTLGRLLRLISSLGRDEAGQGERAH